MASAKRQTLDDYLDTRAAVPVLLSKLAFGDEPVSAVAEPLGNALRSCRRYRSQVAQRRRAR